jgi:hypothetical protein
MHIYSTPLPKVSGLQRSHYTSMLVKIPSGTWLPSRVPDGILTSIEV